MSAFECSVTPTRVRNAKKRNDDREPTIVDLRPFTGKAVVTFEDVPVTKTARRIITLLNPFEDKLKVGVTKLPKPELNVTLEWTQNEIPALGQINLELTWNPMKVFGCREVIQIQDLFNNKKDVSVIFKSVELKKTTARKLGPVTAIKKLKLKSPSPSKQVSRKSTTITTTTSRTVFQEITENFLAAPTSQNHHRQAKSPKKNNLVHMQQTDDVFENINFSTVSNANDGKENLGPATPPNVSTLFDNIRFTPITETKMTGESRLDYLSSLPTPDLLIRDNVVIKQAITGRNILEHRFSPEIAGPQEVLRSWNQQQETPQTGRRNCGAVPKAINSECSAATQKIKSRVDERPEIIFENDIESDTYIKAGDASCNEIELIITDQKSLLGKTHVISTLPLVSITEDNVTSPSGRNFQRTFKVDEFDCQNSRRRILSESMQEAFLKTPEEGKNKFRSSNQGSMPNLNDIDSSITSIEHNRYFFQGKHQPDLSIASNADFHEIEICAQSSRFNLNELGLSPTPTCSPKIKRANLETVGNRASPTRGIAFNASALHQSPTLRRIRKEPQFKSPSQKNVHMTFSPPQKSNFSAEIREMQRRETFTASKGQEIRATTWKQQQAQFNFQVPRIPRDTYTRSSLASQSLTSLSTLSLASATSTSSMPANITHGKLYNEQNIGLYKNPDPFAATTTADPFLSSTMFLDERSVDQIEKTFKKWLNALVTIPADLEADKNEKIDIAKLFTEVQSKELKLAQTKEVVCSSYYLSRLDLLRSDAIKFYQTKEISLPLNKLTANIEKKQLEVKSDRNIHLDLVLQRGLLELLLCYNPLWLRIGLEVVFNVRLNLQSNKDILGMTRFIITNMFKSPYLEQKYYGKYSQQEKYLDALRKHTAKNFLFILFFLDRAKNHRLIKQNPCLFVKQAPYKESLEILKKFASLVLANYGDIVRYLKRLDYVLTHKQTYIDEFDYAFKNLAVDLRDGVRLVKVMEIILMRDDLTKVVRAPAISRLQKVYNVDLALKALRSADYILNGDITAKDIADGHREKTLSLLWQMIYKFRAPIFNNAAITIQKFWRNKWLKVVIERRIQKRHQQKLDKAATVIQKMYRGWRSRQETKIYRHTTTSACIIVQKHARGFLERRAYQRNRLAIICIQRWFRTIQKLKTQRTEFLLMRQSTIAIQVWWRHHILAKRLQAAANIIKIIKQEAFVRHQSAIVIQKTVKSYLVYKKFHAIVHSIVQRNRRTNRENIAAAKVQSLFRMRKERENFLKMKMSVIKIQQFWRTQCETNRLRQQFLLVQHNTVKIQKWFEACLRMKKERENYLCLRRAVINVQQRYRANLLRNDAVTKYQLHKKATITIQRFYRSYKQTQFQRKQFLELRNNVLVVQHQFRAQSMMKIQRQNFLKIKNSVVKVQQKWRATLSMRHQRAEYVQLKMASIIIQERFRAVILMRTEMKMFLKLRNASICIQRRWREKKLMQAENKYYLERKRATILIQHRWRSILQMRSIRRNFLKLKTATIKIQQKWRATVLMRTHAMQFYSLQYYATVVQRQFRAQRAMKKAHGDFLKLKFAAIVIQRRFRAKLQMQDTKKDFEKLKCVTLVIQKKYRAIIAGREQRKRYLNLRSAVINTQQRYRANKLCQGQRSNFLRIKRAVCAIESRYLAKCQMQKNNFEYQSLRYAVINIQQRYRANMLRNEAVNKYQLLKMSTITIQRFYRGFRQTQNQRQKFLELRKSILVVQQRFRAQTMMRNQRQSFLKLKEFVVKIQLKWRATLSMRNQRAEYLQRKSAVHVIETRYAATLRMRQDRNRFTSLQKACIKIQRKMRSTITMRRQRSEFLSWRKSAVVIQNRYRAKNMMDLQRNDYQKKKTSAIKIQRYFRGYLKTKVQRIEYLKLKESVLSMQRLYKSKMLGRAVRRDFTSQRDAAIKIQTFCRCYQLMKKKRAAFLKLKEQTIKIQTRFREKLQTRKDHRNFIEKRCAAIKIQQFWRSLLAMRKQQSEYQMAIRRIVWMQKSIRSNQATKLARLEFIKKKRAAVVIQKSFRGYQKMTVEYSRLRQLKKSVIIIENRYLATKAMRIDRDDFQKLRKATIFIQQKFRSKMEAIESQKKFKDLRILVIKMQALIRGAQARKRFREMPPEVIEERQRNRAARVIQAAWRGRVVRRMKKYRSLREIARRLMMARKNTDPSTTLSAKLKISVEFLTGSYDPAQLIMILAKVEYISRTVPYMLITDAKRVCGVCYGIMGQAIRSEIDKQVIELCSCIILNLGRYRTTAEDAFQKSGLITIAQMLLRWCDKDCGIFNTLCTLVWVFAQSDAKKDIIREFMLKQNGDFIMSQIKQNVLRKERMRKNSRRPIGFQSISLFMYKKDYLMQTDQVSQNIYSSGYITAELLQRCRQLPSLIADYGVVRTKPYIFYSSVFAFDTILTKLNINS